MIFHNVAVAKNQGSVPETLTYSYPSKLPIGQLVSISLRSDSAMGIVTGYETNNRIKNIKPISEVLTFRLNQKSLALLAWLRQFYPFSNGQATQLFLPNTIKKMHEFTPPASKVLPVELNPLQLGVVKKITESTVQTTLLQGDTGSGKTRIYLHLAALSLAENLSSLLLVPEIGLSGQIWQKAKETFGDRAVIYHSGLKQSERAKIWQRVSSGENLVVVGPRSCLFLPFKALGYIVLDEAHEAAYKQDQSPRYDARVVAAKLAQIHGSKLLLGSATPRIQDVAVIRQMGQVIALTGSATGVTNTRQIHIVDSSVREEFSKSYVLSNKLLSHVDTTLSNSEQSLILINRRGTARFIQCANCKWIAQCSQCSGGLTYHHDSYTTQCHICTKKQPVPVSCPECSGLDLAFKNPGTKAIVDELQKILPTAVIGRFDSDNIKSERLDTNMSKLQDGEIDILVGTQLIGKGLDLPKLRTVGIISADSGLLFPDFSSEEKTYQFIHQIIGRVGRGHMDGTVVIQTRLPDSPIITDAIHGNWSAFENRELLIRKAFHYPPFVHLGRIWCRRKSQKTTQQAIEKIYQQLKANKEMLISEPLPSFYEMEHGYYNWQIVLRAKKRSTLLTALRGLPAGDWMYDIDVDNLL